jgi:hypothetical protein
MSLARHEKSIEEFWKVKKGSKGETAWKLLMTELVKIQERYGDAVVEEQLQLGTNAKWNGIRLSSYEQYKPANAPKPKVKKLSPEEAQAQAEREHKELCRRLGTL